MSTASSISSARVNGPKPIAPGTSFTVSMQSCVVTAVLDLSVIARSFQPGIDWRSTSSVESWSSRRTTLMRRSAPPTSRQLVTLPR